MKIVRNTEEIKEHGSSLKSNSIDASKLLIVLGVKLENAGMYLGVNGPVHELLVQWPICMQAHY